MESDLNWSFTSDIFSLHDLGHITFRAFVVGTENKDINGKFRKVVEVYVKHQACTMRSIAMITTWPSIFPQEKQSELYWRMSMAYEGETTSRMMQGQQHCSEDVS